MIELIENEAENIKIVAIFAAMGENQGSFLRIRLSARFQIRNAFVAYSGICICI